MLNTKHKMILSALMLAIVLLMTAACTKPAEEPAVSENIKEEQQDENAEAEEPDEPEEEPAEVKKAVPDEEKFTGDIDALDNTAAGWGPGSAVDDDNRPVGALVFQEEYAAYSADFIRDSETEIYLTFDEGYENGYTPAILDALKEKECPAVFFVTYPYAVDNPDLIQRIIDDGHVLANHSVNHPASGLPSLSREDQENELMELHNYILENYDYEMYLFRYPAGIHSEQSLAIVQSLDYRSVFWSFAHKDWIVDEQPDQGEALNNMVNKLHGGAIYLLHAVSSSNTAVLGDFIDQARAQGYTFAEYTP